MGRWQQNLQSAGGVPRLEVQGGALRGGPNATLSGMPEHVLENIFNQLPGRALANLSATSRQMNQAVVTHSRPALHALPVAPERAPNYISAVRRIWAGNEPGVLPSSLRRQGINPRAVLEAVAPTPDEIRNGYLSAGQIRDMLYLDILDRQSSWYLIERTARQQSGGRRYSL